MFIARQGDVLIVEVAGVLPEAQRVARKKGQSIVLAYGETTGHSHQVIDSAVDELVTADGRRILLSAVPFVVRHEEHGMIEVPAGIPVEIIIQSEYEPERLRQVAD